MFTLNCKGRLLEINEPLVMGIINATPDSFYSGSRESSVDAAVAKAGQMIAEGARILDIGGQSTRPGSKPVGEQEESQRVVPVIRAIAQQFPDTYLSVDTYHASVAEAAVDAGAVIVNDIGGGLFDPQMLSTVAKLKTPYISMHSKGDPLTMHKTPAYTDVTREVLDHFIRQIETCRLNGIFDVIVDPGFGFSKTIDHNFQLLNQLSAFQMLRKPILLGVSRKSTIYKTLGITPEEALNGTTVLNTVGLLKGANILRVHDVREAVEAVKLVRALTRISS